MAGELLDDVAMRWALRDIAARRHKFLKPSEAMIAKLIEINWIEVIDREPVVTELGRHQILSA